MISTRTSRVVILFASMAVLGEQLFVAGSKQTIGKGIRNQGYDSGDDAGDKFYSRSVPKLSNFNPKRKLKGSKDTKDAKAVEKVTKDTKDGGPKQMTTATQEEKVPKSDSRKYNMEADLIEEGKEAKGGKSGKASIYYDTEYPTPTYFPLYPTPSPSPTYYYMDSKGGKGSTKDSKGEKSGKGSEKDSKGGKGSKADFTFIPTFSPSPSSTASISPTTSAFPTSTPSPSPSLYGYYYTGKGGKGGKGGAYYKEGKGSKGTALYLNELEDLLEVVENDIQRIKIDEEKKLFDDVDERMSQIAFDKEMLKHAKTPEEKREILKDIEEQALGIERDQEKIDEYRRVGQHTENDGR